MDESAQDLCQCTDIAPPQADRLRDLNRWLHREREMVRLVDIHPGLVSQTYK